ncbi:MAG: DPP IV N-terminal domain-containing protein, partial [Chloroflexota bacterium]
MPNKKKLTPHKHYTHRWLLALVIAASALTPLYWLRSHITTAPGGTLLVSRTENGVQTSYWLDAKTGDFSVGPSAKMSRVNLAPDNNRVVYAVHPYLYLTDLSGKTPVPISDGPNDSDPQWSPDGQSIVFVRYENFFAALYRYDISADTTTQLTNYQNDLEPDWSP